MLSGTATPSFPVPGIPALCDSLMGLYAVEEGGGSVPGHGGLHTVSSITIRKTQSQRPQVSLHSPGQSTDLFLVYCYLGGH